MYSSNDQLSTESYRAFCDYFTSILWAEQIGGWLYTYDRFVESELQGLAKWFTSSYKKTDRIPRNWSPSSACGHLPVWFFVCLLLVFFWGGGGGLTGGEEGGRGRGSVRACAARVKSSRIVQSLTDL